MCSSPFHPPGIKKVHFLLQLPHPPKKRKIIILPTVPTLKLYIYLLWMYFYCLYVLYIDIYSYIVCVLSNIWTLKYEVMYHFSKRMEYWKNNILPIIVTYVYSQLTVVFTHAKLLMNQCIYICMFIRLLILNLSCSFI